VNVLFHRRFYRSVRLTVSGMCFLFGANLIVASYSWAELPWDTMAYTNFNAMQAVNADGSPAWTIPTWGVDEEQGYKLRGVVLNYAKDLLDLTPNYIPSDPGTLWQLGAQWQLFIQATNVSDFGGAALWMGQNYGNHIWHWNPDGSSSTYSYTNTEWMDELARLTLNNTLLPGDLIEIRARGGLFYQGKFNVNEQHDNDPVFDFDIQLISHETLPDPILISIADLKNPDDTFKFVQDRLSGAEHYQATRVRLEDVSLVSTAGWGPDATLTITDGTHTLPMKLGLNGFDLVSAPTSPFDVVGIFDQEGNPYNTGYRLWVTDASQFSAIPEPSLTILLSAMFLCLSVWKLRKNHSTD